VLHGSDCSSLTRRSAGRSFLALWPARLHKTSEARPPLPHIPPENAKFDQLAPLRFLLPPRASSGRPPCPLHSSTLFAGLLFSPETSPRAVCVLCFLCAPRPQDAMPIHSPVLLSSRCFSPRLLRVSASLRLDGGIKFPQPFHHGYRGQDSALSLRLSVSPETRP
jgi:hypothetical protein